MIFVLKAMKGKDKEILADFVWDSLALHDGVIDCGMTPEYSFELPGIPGNLIFSIQVDGELVAAIYADKPGLLIELKEFEYTEELIQKFKAINGHDFELCSIPALKKELRDLAFYLNETDPKKDLIKYEEKYKLQKELLKKLSQAIILSEGLCLNTKEN